MPTPEKYRPFLRLSLLVALPLSVLIFGTTISIYFAKNKPKITKKKQTHQQIWEVDVLKLSPQKIEIKIEGFGSVRPERKAKLTSEISGKITYVLEMLKPGNFVGANEILIKIDSKAHKAAKQLAQADLEQSKAELLRLQESYKYTKKEVEILKEQRNLAQKEVARNEKLVQEGRISEKELDKSSTSHLQLQQTLVTRERELATLPHQIKKAKVAIERHKTNLQKAQHNLTKTNIAAPFSAQIISTNIEVGQHVSAGTELAVLAYDRSYEVVVKVAPEEMKNIPFVSEPNLPKNLRNVKRGIIGTPKAQINWYAFGKNYTWQGILARIEPIDEKTRTLPLVVQIRNPWEGLRTGETPPLLTGIYCKASIEGEKSDRAMILPEKALREQNRVYILRQGKLVMEKLHIYQFLPGQIVLYSKRQKSLRFGDLVVTSEILYPVAQMPLKIRKKTVQGGAK